MQKSKKSKIEAPPKKGRKLKSAKENLLIDKEKRYVRTRLGPQVENQTTLKEKKKSPLPKPKVKQGTKKKKSS